MKIGKICPLILAAATASSEPTVDWCFEYDELRFVMDAATTSINAWTRHVQLIDHGIHNALGFMNSKLVDGMSPKLTLDNVGFVASNASSPFDERHIQKLNSLLELFKEPLRLEKRHVETAFRDLVLPFPRLLRSDAAVLISRMIMGLVEMRKLAIVDMEDFSFKQNSAHNSIVQHKTEIESCFADQVVAAQLATAEWTRRLNRVQSVMDRFLQVREIIVAAIGTHSVRPVESLAIAESLKISCLESVKSVIFDSQSSITKSLPRSIKKSLQQRHWDFLTVWLQALDDLELNSRHQYEKLIVQINRKLEIFRNSLLFNQSMLDQLAKDSHASSHT